MSNSVDPDEMAHYEPSHLDLCCLQKPIIITCGSERVNDMSTLVSFPRESEKRNRRTNEKNKRNK